MGKTAYFCQCPIFHLSGLASLPAPLGNSAMFEPQLGRDFLSDPLNVAYLGRCHMGLGTLPGDWDRGKQVRRHSSFANSFVSTRRGRVGAAVLGLLFMERGIDCSPEVAFWSLRMKAAPFQLKARSILHFFELPSCEIFPLFLLRGCFYINSKKPRVQHLTLLSMVYEQPGHN